MDYYGLSSKQAQILDYIKSEIRKKGYPPSVREIGGAVGLSSPSTVHSHLAVLEKKGYIRRDQSKPRALEIIDDSSSNETLKEMVDIPILGQINAGMPAYAEENFEDTFPVPLDFLHSNSQLFMLKVKGESMIEAGIFAGDYLIVERSKTVRNGEIAVALIENEATVKTFYREKDHVRLQPENSSMSPIIVKDVEILGKAIGLFRRF